MSAGNWTWVLSQSTILLTAGRSFLPTVPILNKIIRTSLTKKDMLKQKFYDEAIRQKVFIDG